MIVSYIHQLVVLASKAGIDLRDAMKSAGVADSQFYRWRQGKGSPRYETAKRIAKKIQGAKKRGAVSRI